VREPDTLRTPDELLDSPDDAWIVSYAPLDLVLLNPRIRPLLEEVAPVTAWPTVWATETVWAEVRGAGFYTYLPADPLIAQARIYAMSDIRRAADASELLAIAAIEADSDDGPTHPATAALEPTGLSRSHFWRSDATPMPHRLRVRFAAPVALGEVQVVQPTPVEERHRVSRLEVRAIDEAGVARTVWRGDGLEDRPLVVATWPTTTVAALELVVERQASPFAESRSAAIEELVFPGHRPVLVR